MENDILYQNNQLWESFNKCWGLRRAAVRTSVWIDEDRSAMHDVVFHQANKMLQARAPKQGKGILGWEVTKAKVTHFQRFFWTPREWQFKVGSKTLSLNWIWYHILLFRGCIISWSKVVFNKICSWNLLPFPLQPSEVSRPSRITYRQSKGLGKEELMEVTNPPFWRQNWPYVFRKPWLETSSFLLCDPWLARIPHCRSQDGVSHEDEWHWSTREMVPGNSH